MKGGSVLAHVTDWNDEADEERAPKGEQKRALPRTPPKELSPFGILQNWGGFRGLDGYWLLTFWGRNGNPVSHSALGELNDS